MPPKYLNRQRPQQIGLDLVPVPTSSSNRNTIVPRNETKPISLRTDVQSYLANLEKTLHAKSNLNNDSNERAKAPVVTEKTQSVVNKSNVLNERQNEVLHWSDLSISSESPDSSVTKQKVARNVASKPKDNQKPASDYSISSSIINLKTLSDISMITEIEKKAEPKNFSFQKNNKDISVGSSTNDLESSLPPKSPFHPFTFKMVSSNSSSIKTAKSVNSDSESESDLAVEESVQSNTDTVSNVIEPQQVDYDTDFESEESGYEESEQISTSQSSNGHSDSVPVKTTLRKERHSNLSSAVTKATQTDLAPMQNGFPFAMQPMVPVNYGLSLVPWAGNNFQYTQQSAHIHPQSDILATMDELLRSALSAHLECIKNFANFQYSVYDEWNKISMKQHRKKRNDTSESDSVKTDDQKQ